MKEDIIEWTPKQGEMIEVSDNKDWFEEKKFICKYKGKFICINPYGNFFAWSYARPIKKDVDYYLREEIEQFKSKIHELELDLKKLEAKL